MIDSAGLGLLIALLKHVGGRGGDLKLSALPKRVRLVFEITRTHRIFEIHDSLEEAILSAK
jgi:anti-sigma B factor antagonist